MSADAASVRQDNHLGCPQREWVGYRGYAGEWPHHEARPSRRAPRVAVQRIADDHESFDREGHDIPDAHEAEHVRQVDERLTQSLRVEQRYMHDVQPRRREHEQEAAIGESQGGEIHIAGVGSQRRAAEDGEREGVADEPDDDDDGD